MGSRSSFDPPGTTIEYGQAFKQKQAKTIKNSILVREKRDIERRIRCYNNPIPDDTARLAEIDVLLSKESNP